MVARPSLKRVVPGSVPPWRALCAESARALKAFFSILCVSNCFAPRIQVRADIARAKLARFLGQALVPARGPRARRGPASRFRVFFVAPSLRPRRGFPLPAIKKARQPFVIITLDPLSEHFRGRNSLGFARRRTSKLAGRCG